jgi:hypothetical protein
VVHVDAAVSELLLAAVQPAQIELALAATEQAESERQLLHRHWQERLERARYEATLARRRYEQVDPDNRLVAGELERRWEQQLHDVQAVESQWTKAQAQAPLPLSAAEQEAIRRLAQDLPALWHAPTTAPSDRKRLLRCLIQSVTLDSFSQVGLTRILVLWHTGATSEVSVPRPRPGCRTPEASRRRIAELAQSLSDDQIAEQLNAEGLPTAWRGPWTQARVRIVRSKWRIPSARPYSPRQILPRNQGFFSASEAAERLHVSPGMVLRLVPPRPPGRLPGTPPHRRLGAADPRRSLPLWRRSTAHSRPDSRGRGRGWAGPDRSRNAPAGASRPATHLSSLAQPRLALVRPTPRCHPASF